MVVLLSLHRAQLTLNGAGWRQHFGGIQNIEFEAAVERGTARMVGSAGYLLTADNGLPSRRRGTTIEALASGIDCVGIVLLKAGAIEGTSGELPIRISAGDIRLVDMSSARDWQAVDHAQLEEISLFAPRQRFARLFANRSLDDWTAPANSVAGAVIGAALGALGDKIDKLDNREFDAFAGALIGITMSAIDANRPAAYGPDSLGFSIFARIRNFIDHHLGSTALTPDLIAGDFGLSRAVLYRMFEPVGGVATYIRRQRMARALNELSAQGTNGRRVGAIARRCGYASAAGFSRAFSETYGVSPREIASLKVRHGGANRRVDWLAPLCGRSPSHT